MARRRPLSDRKRNTEKGDPRLEAAMEEVHTNIPSTVERASHFGPGGREAMLRAIAYSKARKAGARIPKRRGRR